MFNFSTQELIIVLVIALVVFGPGKLPEVGKAIGKGINEFKDAMSPDKDKKKAEAQPAEPTVEGTAAPLNADAGAKNDQKQKEMSDDK